MTEVQPVTRLVHLPINELADSDASVADGFLLLVNDGSRLPSERRLQFFFLFFFL